ncbi:RING finger protein (macronuclear) [Tetrahymena thermophila SB210]|uniref:RING-type E3 ubiquitin transferase n=1 Tax=Tetrahymena thermophila (strain SB210) TaxID=312017 RepID=Q22UI7_TETTS|nr:RING finger protein [Tetrahymena thermophila SB210]EAR88983.1 RING finger protein [Tetrahymena thermophila SB210]|eukprot:XP_001009228.1 RING finger protein [Tetrahymena thermophila SB210]
MINQQVRQSSQRAFIIQISPRDGSHFNPLSIPVPVTYNLSMANLPTSLDIENHGGNNNNSNNNRDGNVFLIQFQGNNTNYRHGLQFVHNQIRNNLEFYRNQSRQITINQQTFLVKPYYERDMFQDQSNNIILQQLQDNHGVYINQLQFASLLSLGQQINDKINTDISTQIFFMMIQTLCMIPSICYFSLANNLFSHNIASDIYVLLIMISNLLIIINRYFLYVKLKLVYNEIDFENYKTPQVILFLIHLRDQIGLKSINTLTRQQIQDSIQKSFNSYIVLSLNILNIIQYALLFFSIYFYILSDQYSDKIRNESSIAAILVMSYTSLIISFLYTAIYAFTVFTIGITLACFGIICFVGYIIYQIFYYFFFVINKIATKICGVTDYFDNNNQIAPTSIHSNYQFYAEAYVKRNTKQIIYSSEKCKDSLCSICLEEYVEGKTQLKQMICCKSSFHIPCIVNWSLEKKTCPNCRSEDVFAKKQKRRAQYFSNLINNNQQSIQQNPSSNGFQINQQQPQPQLQVEENLQQIQPNEQQQTQTLQQRQVQQPQQQQQSARQQQQNNNQEIREGNSSQNRNDLAIQGSQQLNNSTQTIQLSRIENPQCNQLGQQQQIESLKSIQVTQIQAQELRNIQPYSQIEIDDNHILHNHRKSDQNFITLINLGRVEKQDSHSIEEIKHQDELQKFDSYNSIKIEDQQDKKTKIKSKNDANSQAFIQISNQEIGSKTQFMNQQIDQQRNGQNKLSSLDCLDNQSNNE